MTDTRFKPGQSGNPSGRPPNSGPIGEIRKAIGEELPAIVSKLVEMAKEGDVQAARVLVERAIPAIKPVDFAQVIELTGNTLTDQGRSALAAMASGQIAPAQAAQLITALAGLAKLIETTELEQRISALENAREDRT